MRPNRDPAAVAQDSADLRSRTLFVLGVRFEDQIPDAVLCGLVRNRPEQREGSPLTVHGVLTRGKCDIPPVPCPPLPDGELDQFQAG